MPIIEIDGVGRVEVDDSFLQLSPQQQEATVNEIVSSTRSAPPPRQPSAQQGPTPAPQPPSDREIYAPDGFGGNAYDNENDRFNDAWAAQQEADYQASLKQPSASPQPTPPTPPAPERTSRLGAFGLGALDGITFGLDDEIGGGLAAVIPGVGNASIWEGKSLADAANENIDAYRHTKKAAEDEHLGYFVGGGLAGGLLPFTGGLGGLKATSSLGKLGRAATSGAAYGAAYGFGSDEGGITDRLDGAAGGAALGAIGGTTLHGATKAGEAALSPLARRLFPKLADAQFAKTQATNPHALTDAKVADDLDKIVRTLSVDSAKRKLSKAQQSTLLSRIDGLEASYLPLDEIKALDLPPSVKSRLQTAMAKRHLLSDGEVQSLRDGTPAGDAVANAIEKARRLRAYVPEGGNGAGNRLAATMGDAIGSTAGWKLGGPIGGAVGGSIGRAAMSRLSARQAKEALALAEKAPSFAKLPEVVAAKASGVEGGDGLSRLSADALDASYNAQRAAQQETERLTTEGRKVAIANARDDVKPSGGWRGTIYERTGLLPSQQDAGALKALNDGAISPEQFQAYLDDPSKLMTGNAGNALIDRLGSMADDGVLRRDPKWTPQAASSHMGREAAQAAFHEADALWKQAQDADAALFDRTGLDRTQRPTAAAVEEAFSKREQAQRSLQEATTVRNPTAYAATAKANQQRVTETLAAVRENPALPHDARETIATAITAIGNTSIRERAQAIATDALDRLGDDNRELGRSLLSPLVQQIRH